MTDLETTVVSYVKSRPGCKVTDLMEVGVDVGDVWPLLLRMEERELVTLTKPVNKPWALWA